MCSDIFGKQFVVEMIQENIHSSNLFYGGIDKYNVNLYSFNHSFPKQYILAKPLNLILLQATNAVLIYGSIDPWHKLGMYSNPEKSVVIHLNNGKTC